MKIVSFDVGIKNMGYCIFDISNNKPYITQWEIMDLVEDRTFDKREYPTFFIERNDHY